ncbi:tripartite tricarboxylate transporter permease [Hoeflea sp. WL0058]|uniref:Tripartite tricarboxylate transporter permease n=1 Tax=Flavimaribacter sediminis TaxID=2865987 RepID=A0AAE3D134_9HYPH|nr:tripartite tricarboxylate transporter permease [Flavimaribacter sediminis]MBW8637446.1 tripartite tricarboxylate transporter permease [Flavimaribacter sediminis]
MGILEGIASGFLQTVSLAVLPYLVIGSLFGLVVGVIPGLSGHFAMAMAVTFLYSMEPGSGIAFLLGAHATVSQGGGITAILFGIPGSPQNAATLLDGPAMRDKGDLGIALGAAMTSCLLGATFGAVALALFIPVLQETVLFFGPPEIVILAFLSLTFVAVLGREDMMRSLIAALAGLLLAMVGLDNVTNTERFTFGFERLADGLSLVPVVLGLFAVAEMIELWSIAGPLARGQAKIESSRQVQKQIFEGVRAAFGKWWLVLRCSAIGTLMGLIPGLGSAPAAFVAYGHAKQSSKNKESFGKGNVEGVIGPEAANDAVEGGALASTIAFGIPGSSSMAILLSGLFILGLETGPQMLNQHVDIVFIMIFTIILGNLIGTVFGMFLVNPLSRVTTIRSSMLAPALMAVIVSGAYASNGSLLDIAVALVFGVFGYLMKRFNYSRAALLIGFVLGFVVEKNLYLALMLDGPLFIAEPLPFGLAMIAVVFLAYNVVSIYRNRNRAMPATANDVPAASGRPSAEPHGSPATEIWFLAFICVLVLAAFLEAFRYEMVSARTPFVIMTPLLFLMLLQAWRIRSANPKARTGDIPVTGSTTEGGPGKIGSMLFSMAALFALIALLGHFPGILIYGFLSMYLLARERLVLSAIVSISVTAALFVVFELAFNIEMYDGLVFRYLLGYRDF